MRGGGDVSMEAYRNGCMRGGEHVRRWEFEEVGGEHVRIRGLGICGGEQVRTRSEQGSNQVGRRRTRDAEWPIGEEGDVELPCAGPLTSAT